MATEPQLGVMLPCPTGSRWWGWRGDAWGDAGRCLPMNGGRHLQPVGENWGQSDPSVTAWTWQGRVGSWQGIAAPVVSTCGWAWVGVGH